MLGRKFSKAYKSSSSKNFINWKCAVSGYICIKSPFDKSNNNNGIN